MARGYYGSGASLQKLVEIHKALEEARQATGENHFEACQAAMGLGLKPAAMLISGRYTPIQVKCGWDKEGNPRKDAEEVLEEAEQSGYNYDGPAWEPPQFGSSASTKVTVTNTVTTPEKTAEEKRAALLAKMTAKMAG